MARVSQNPKDYAAGLENYVRAKTGTIGVCVELSKPNNKDAQHPPDQFHKLVWEKCKDRRDKYGFSFKQAIFSGAKWTNSGVGIYAGSHDSYYAFSPLFDKVIQDYHGHSKTAKHISSMDVNSLKCPPFPADEDKMINSTRIRVARNLAAYPLGTAISRKDRLEVEKLVTSALGEMTGELKGKYYSLKTMTAEEKK